MGIAVLSLLLCALPFSVRPEDWTHHTVLDGDGKYHLYWKPPEDKKGDSKITFKVEVETKGYVGFGLSPNGGMAGSDILTAWIKNGKFFFQDRHGVGDSLPIKDSKEDWDLITGYENDTFTVFEFSRKLDTCDENDMPIDESTMRVIYAYSDKDPENGDPTYHWGKRGSKSVMLLQSKLRQNLHIDTSSLLRWDIQSPDIDISANETLYWCKIFRTPKLSKKHHIVYVKPLIQERHEQFVHHVLLYECVGAEPEEYESFSNYTGHVCRHPNMPNAMKKCEGVSLAWAVGGEDILLPEHVGLPLDPDPGTYYMMEIHYDNPLLKPGIIDHSGLSIYYTPNLRKFDAGCLMIGSTITPRMFIPPHQKEYIVVGHSNPQCLGPAFPKEGVKALGVILHSHLLGRRIKARHFRGSNELVPLAEEKSYDFNYQEYRYYTDEVAILPHDQITVECNYDSSQRENITYGGEGTTDEMCLAFILFYPRIDRYASLSVPTFENINKVLNTNITDVRSMYTDTQNYNWSSTNITEVENIMRNSAHNTHCYFGNGEKDMVKSLISYPSNLKSFVKESVCNGSMALRQAQSLFILICIICLMLNL